MTVGHVTGTNGGVYYPICSMYGIFIYIWVIFRANVGKYSIHGAYGYWWDVILPKRKYWLVVKQPTIVV